MKSPDEIVARISACAEDDWFGVQRSDLIAYLPYEQAKPFLKPEVTAEEWKPAVNTPEAIKAAMRDYLAFAWDKANNCRGLSASRSVDHMKAYLWLLREETALAKLNSAYEFYGKPCLVICSRICGFDWRKADDGAWQNDERGTDYCTADRGLEKHGIAVED